MTRSDEDRPQLPEPSHGDEDGLDPDAIPAVEGVGIAPRESEPPAWIEENLVAALRAEGVIRNGRSRRPGFTLTPAWGMAAAIAALALFGAGFLMGDERGTQRTLAAVEVVSEANATQQAYQIQRTGSLYVEALAAMGNLQGEVDDEARRQGIMAARSIMWAAAAELARLDPSDAAVQQVMAMLGGGQDNSEAGAVRTYLWF